MLKIIDGAAFLGLLEGGIRNIELHRSELNELNVFPVPDGDTGTNMLMTLKQGLLAADRTASLSDASRSFASAAVLGARGNSGVIVSQFIKGIAEGFVGLDKADVSAFSGALTKGVGRAYSAVAKPTEGTMLTVARQSADALSRALPENLDEAIDIILVSAKLSLQRTPELLPVLKKAGVVDSGGAGIVYLFEGMKKYLSGESIELGDEDVDVPERMDLSLFDKNTEFTYGYCVEGVLQLKRDVCDFDLEDFIDDLSDVGESIVATLENDKVKLHIHVKKLGRIMDLVQKYGELLTVKIENMTVQNVLKSKANKELEPEKFLVSEASDDQQFATVAVASTPRMQRLFFDMGADVVIYSELAPSSEDFLSALALTGKSDILVFPNSSNSILASMQAAGLYKQARVTVLNSRSTADCYATLAVLDFDGTASDAAAIANATLSAMRTFFVYHATKDFKYGKRTVKKNEFFALFDKRVIGVGDTLESVTSSVLGELTKTKECSVVTVFYGRNIADDFVNGLCDRLKLSSDSTEVAAVPTDETVYSLMVSLE